MATGEMSTRVQNIVERMRGNGVTFPASPRTVWSQPGIGKKTMDEMHEAGLVSHWKEWTEGYRFLGLELKTRTINMLTHIFQNELTWHEQPYYHYTSKISLREMSKRFAKIIAEPRGRWPRTIGKSAIADFEQALRKKRVPVLWKWPQPKKYAKWIVTKCPECGHSLYGTQPKSTIS